MPIAARLPEPIANAIVRYENKSITGMVTSEDGKFLTSNLDPGEYRFTVTAEGFKDGECLTFPDEFGVPHHIEVISTRREGANVITTLMVDHSFQTFSVQVEGHNKAAAAG